MYAHTHAHTACVMSEGAGAETTSSQISARGGGGGGGGAAATLSSVDRGATPADLLAAGEAIDELTADYAN